MYPGYQRCFTYLCMVSRIQRSLHQLSSSVWANDKLPTLLYLHSPAKIQMDLRCLAMRLKSLRGQVAKDSHTLQSCSVLCSLSWLLWELTQDQAKYSNGSRTWQVRFFYHVFYIVCWHVFTSRCGWVSWTCVPPTPFGFLTIAQPSLMTWFGISVTYIRFHRGFKLQGFDRAKLPYSSGLQPYLAYYAAITTWVICFVSIIWALFYHLYSDPLR